MAVLASLLLLLCWLACERRVWNYERYLLHFLLVIPSVLLFAAGLVIGGICCTKHVYLKTLELKDNFTMCRDTFLYLCQQLRPETECEKSTHFKQHINVENHVAVTLRCLATTVEYRTVSRLFGTARSTVCTIIIQTTCKATVSCLLPTYIQFPTDAALQDVVDGLLHSLHTPQCAGATDGCHIPVTPSALNHTDYYNRTGWYSVHPSGSC